MGLLSIPGSLMETAPKVPSLQKLDPMAEALKATTINQANEPGLADLARKTNLDQQDTRLAMLRRAIPNFDKIFGQEGDVLSEQLSGHLSAAALAAANEAGNIGAWKMGSPFGGTIGSSFSKRSAYQESLAQIERGTHNNWLQEAAHLTMPNEFNISSMFLNPTQVYQMNNEQNLQQFQRSFTKNQINNPYKWNNIVGKGLADFGNEIESTGFGILSAYAGGAAGGMAGGKGGGGGAPTSYYLQNSGVSNPQTYGGSYNGGSSQNFMFPEQMF